MAAIAPVPKFSSVQSVESREARRAALARPLSDTSSRQAFVGVLLLFFSLGIAAGPLFDGSFDAESMRDNDGLLVRKNASYAKAYFMGSGFFNAFVDRTRSNATASSWFPQPYDSDFLGFPFLDQSDFANGPCAILDASPSAKSLDCIITTGHEGGVSAYGLCRNGSEFVSIHYLLLLVTPTDIGGLLSAGTWVENLREVIMVGLSSPPECVGDNKLVIHPDLSDLREMTGAFERAPADRVNRWFDIVTLPVPVLKRLFYVAGKQDNRQGLVLPSRKRQCFDNIIAQNAFGATLADRLEFVAPFRASKYVYITLYRVAGAEIELPRLQFTFAVAAQALLLLIFFLCIATRNSSLDTYHLVQQILRLPTFCLISLQLLYVLYYQIFGISFVANNTAAGVIYTKKIVYATGVSFILLHQLDVRAAITLWPKMANNDSYYFARIVWMLASLGVVVWSLLVRNPDHYIVRTLSTCTLGASECNITRRMLFQHYVCLCVLIAHPAVYGVIQVIHWRRNPSEYLAAGARTAPDQETSFERVACGGALTEYYYYNTLIATAAPDGSHKTRGYATCPKAVRDEGFVLLGGCGLLVRAKDLYVVLLMKLVNWRVAGLVNLSIVVAFIVDDQVTAMRRISYQSLWVVCQRWDGRISYPSVG